MRTVFIAFIIIFNGCSIKEYTMFQTQKEELNQLPQELNVTIESRILPDDVLIIDIYNMNQKSNILRDTNILNSGVNNYDPRNKYIVEPDGTIYLPLIKEISVAGLTTQELNRKLTEAYARYLKEPYVKTKIANHRVYVLGEVRKQGLVPIVGSSISLIEAISKSGGVTDDGVLSRIRVISKVNGRSILRTVNLTKFNTLNIDNLMLANNSIVYVEPRSSKAFKLGIDNYLPLINAIGTVSGTLLNIDTLGTSNLINSIKHPNMK